MQMPHLTTMSNMIQKSAFERRVGFHIVSCNVAWHLFHLRRIEHQLSATTGLVKSTHVSFRIFIFTNRAISSLNDAIVFIAVIVITVFIVIYTNKIEINIREKNKKVLLSHNKEIKNTKISTHRPRRLPPNVDRLQLVQLSPFRRAHAQEEEYASRKHLQCARP